MVNWHEKQVIYQIYPKSFKDTNDDGIGDLQGVIQKIPYLKALGITTIWLNPIYVSPQVDNGYDVADYYQIDQSVGSMADVEALIQALHQNGMHLLLDFVMNHTSDQHPWFQAALKDPQSKYHDYYLWAQAKPGQLPNNWGSFFGGSVWEPTPKAPNHYYFHLFDRHMPDLNWQNPAVRQAMIEIAKFWLNKGIDGLRLDAFIHIDKANFSQFAAGASQAPVIDDTFYAHLSRVQPYLREFCHALRVIKPDVFILGEAASASPELLIDYSRPQNDECDAVITFRSIVDRLDQLDSRLPAEFQPKALDVEGMRQRLTTIETKLADVSLPVLYWSNHDMARVASRYASTDYYWQSLKCLAAMLYLQRGLPIIYYGEELGIKNSYLKQLSDFHDQTVLPFYQQALAVGYSAEQTMKMLNRTHKMAARGMMPWDSDQPYQGFSKHEPWLNGQQTMPVSVATEAADPTSLLVFYRQLLQLKQTPLFTAGDEVIQPTANGVFQYTRQLAGQLATVTCNLSDTAQLVTNNDGGQPSLTVGTVGQHAGQLNYSPWSMTVTINDTKEF